MSEGKPQGDHSAYGMSQQVAARDLQMFEQAVQILDELIEGMIRGRCR